MIGLGRRLLAVLIALAACTKASDLAPPASLPAHPRIILTTEREAVLRAAIASGEGDAAAFSRMLYQHADWVLQQPVQQHGVPGSTGVLINVRNALDYMLTSALAHRLRPGAASGTSPYLERAVKEALNLAVTWPDWNTEQHALDTGEALLATCLAYDWLYSSINASVRTSLVDGIVKLGLVPYRE